MQVQAQIAAVSKSIEEAENALPSLTKEQQDVQVRLSHLFAALAGGCTAWAITVHNAVIFAQ